MNRTISEVQGEARIPSRDTIESKAHRISRRLIIALRALLVIALVTTVVCLFYFPQRAYLPAVLVPVLWVILLGVQHLEHRAKLERRRRRTIDRITDEEVRLGGVVPSCAALSRWVASNSATILPAGENAVCSSIGCCAMEIELPNKTMLHF